MLYTASMVAREVLIDSIYSIGVGIFTLSHEILWFGSRSMSNITVVQYEGSMTSVVDDAMIETLMNEKTHSTLISSRIL